MSPRFGMVRGGRLSIGSHRRAWRLFCCWWINRFSSLYLSLPFRATRCSCLFSRFCEIFHHMEPVGALNCLGSALAGSAGIMPSAIPADQIDVRVGVHPHVGGFCLAIGDYEGYPLVTPGSFKRGIFGSLVELTLAGHLSSRFCCHVSVSRDVS